MYAFIVCNLIQSKPVQTDFLLVNIQEQKKGLVSYICMEVCEGVELIRCVILLFRKRTYDLIMYLIISHADDVSYNLPT